jgi:selenocysteine lyase/cysteine desulfurase
MRNLYDGLSCLGVSLLTPPQETVWSGMVSFSSEEADAIGRELEKKGIVVWYGDGRVRIWVHLCNDEHDIDLLLEALRKILRTAKF